MPKLRTIRRRVYLRLLRWRIATRSHPLRTVLVEASLAIAAIGALGGRYLAEHVPLWLGYITRPISQAMQTHPLLAKWMHVLINAVPDLAYALLALAGLAYLVPEVTAKLESRRPVRIFLFALFALMGLSAILVNAVNRADQEDRDRMQSTEQTKVLGSVLDIQAMLHSNKTLTEAQRKEALFESLRDEYIITHNPIDPDILAKTKMPPDDWTNMRLEQMGEGIRVATVKTSPTPAVIQEAPQPEEARLTFTLWDATASTEHVVLSKLVRPNSDGSYLVEFATMNVSDVAADSLEMWLKICDGCSFVGEPNGFTRPAGMEDRARYRSWGNLNAGAFTEKMSAFVKGPSEGGAFQVGVRYACKNCARSFDFQRATITPIGLIPPHVFKLRSPSTFGIPKPGPQ